MISFFLFIQEMSFVLLFSYAKISQNETKNKTLFFLGLVSSWFKLVATLINYNNNNKNSADNIFNDPQ